MGINQIIKQKYFHLFLILFILIIRLQYEVKVTCNNLSKTRIWNILSTNLLKCKHQGNLGH